MVLGKPQNGNGNKVLLWELVRMGMTLQEWEGMGTVSYSRTRLLATLNHT